jgi:hypothetical protein
VSDVARSNQFLIGCGQLNWYLDKAYAQFQQRKVWGGAKGHDRNTGMLAATALVTAYISVRVRGEPPDTT